MNKRLHDAVEIDDLIKELQKAKERGITKITNIETDVRTDIYIYGGNRICGIGFWSEQKEGCIFVPFSKYSERIKNGASLRKGSSYGRECTNSEFQQEKDGGVGMKNKQYYIDKHMELYDECLIEAGESNSDDVIAGADSLYGNCATVDHIVGYYIYWYGDSALKTWKENLIFKIERNGFKTDMDKDVTMILEELFSS